MLDAGTFEVSGVSDTPSKEERMHIETNRRLRGHRFFPTAAELSKYPRLYAQSEKGLDAVVLVHYFASSVDIYVTEFDVAGFAESAEAYGYTWLAGYETGEFGYVDLRDIEQINQPGGLIRDTSGRSMGRMRAWFERDLYWTPKTINQIIAERRKAEEAAQARRAARAAAQR